MPLVIRRDNGRSQPGLVCDTCGQLVVGDPWGAIVKFPAKGDEHGNFAAFVYHKGNCDPEYARGGDPGPNVNSMELAYYLPWLLENHGWGTRKLGKEGKKLTLEVPKILCL